MTRPQTIVHALICGNRLTLCALCLQRLSDYVVLQYNHVADRADTPDGIGTDVRLPIVQFIHDALQDSDGPNKILVHCEAGQSRSVAVICGYLMKTLKWSLEDAVRKIRCERTRFRLDGLGVWGKRIRGDPPDCVTFDTS